jgi:hypothetical protein
MASYDEANSICWALIGGIGDNATGTCHPKDGCPVLSTTYIYDIATNIWDKGPDTMVPHTDTCAAAAGGEASKISLAALSNPF